MRHDVRHRTMIAGKPIGRAVLIGDLLADKYLVAAGYVPRRGIGGWGRRRRRWRRRRSGCSRRRVKSVGPCRRPLGPDREACGENARKRHHQKSELAPHNPSPSVEPSFRDATNHFPAWRRASVGLQVLASIYPNRRSITLGPWARL